MSPQDDDEFYHWTRRKLSEMSNGMTVSSILWFTYLLPIYYGRTDLKLCFLLVTCQSASMCCTISFFSYCLVIIVNQPAPLLLQSHCTLLTEVCETHLPPSGHFAKRQHRGKKYYVNINILQLSQKENIMCKNDKR